MEERTVLIKQSKKLLGKGITVTQLAYDADIGYGSLWRMIHEGIGHIRNWEKLDKYYKKRKIM